MASPNKPTKKGVSQSDDTGPKDIDVSSPIPIKSLNAFKNQDQFKFDNNGYTSFDSRSFTPNTWGSVQNHLTRRPSYNTLVSSREKHYNLDYPKDSNELLKLQLDPTSRFFARSRPRTLNLPSLLPYKIENPEEQAKFLSHIVSHLYIAIKSLDIQGSLSISAKDLAALKDSISDVDIALETTLFEMNNTEEEEIVEEIDSSDEEMDSSDDEEVVEDDSDEDDKDATNQHKKSPKSAAVVSVRTWTHELLIWMKMKYDMPLSLRVNLSKVYYALCLCRGQHVNVKTYVRVFELLTSDQKLLADAGLKLSWVELYEEFQNLFPSPIHAMEKKDQKYLSKLASRASRFYDPKSLPEIFAKLGNNFSPSVSALTISAFPLLPTTFGNGVNDIYDIRHYIEPLFHMWLKLNKNKDLEDQITCRLGIIAMETLIKLNDEPILLGKFGIFTKDQMEFLFNDLLNSLGIRISKFSSKKVKYFHGFASTIVFSITESQAEIIDYIRSLINAIESYVHPSNSGDWTRPISKFILAIIYQFHKRYNMENEIDGLLYKISVKLSSTTVHEFVKIMLPIVKIGIQSKKSDASGDYLSALNLLSLLDSEYVLENTLLDIYESLEGVISTHRVLNALRMIDSLARPLVSTPVFRVHLTRILSLIIPGIDSNDLVKTLQTLEVFSAIANFTPIYNLNEYEDTSLAMEFTQNHIEYLQRKIYNNDEIFEYDKNLEIEALKSSTSAFKDIFKSLAQRVPPLLENLPDPAKSSGLEKDLAISLPKFFYVIFESMSDEIFKIFKDELFEFVFNNVHHLIAITVGELCGAIIKRDPKSFKLNATILMEKIRDEIDENGAGTSRSIEVAPRDQALYWYLTIFKYCAGNAGSQLVKMPELKEFSFYLMDHIEGACVSVATSLVFHILQNVTKIRVKESRLISPEYETKHGITEKCWGGFWDSKTRFENIRFDWFVPTEVEVQFAYKFFNDHVMKCIENIMNLMKNYENNPQPNNSIVLLDSIRKNLLYFNNSLSGVAFLLDPSFEEDIPILNHENETIQQRLSLLNKIRNSVCSTQKDTTYEEKQKVSGDIQKVIEELKSEDLLEYITGFENLGEIEESPKPKSPLKSAPKSAIQKELTPVSGRETPSIEGVQMSSTNPAITFREKSLYTSSYFFGNTKDKKFNDLYMKIHKTRYLVGKSLHYICKFLLANFHDNTRVFKNLLNTINVWISDVGRERLHHSSNAEIDYGYVSFLQTINRIRKPFTRIAIGARLESYHQSRLSLHATARSETGLDRVLVEDVINLSGSTYSTISSSAQKVLLDCMRRISGSYSHIVRSTTRNLTKALEANDDKKIESILKVLNLKRIKYKLSNDYINVQKYIDLLERCLKIDEPKVHKVCQSLFDGICKNITTPSYTCIIDHDAIDLIRPPDEYIDLEIKAVQLAKDKKRKLYFDKLKKLEDKIIEDDKPNLHWKISLSNQEFLVNLQSHLDIQLRGDILEKLFHQAGSGHPIISRQALHGITKLIDKLEVLSSFKYDLNNAYDLNFIPDKDLKIDTTGSFTSKWFKEMSDENPEYYIDTKPNSGWLFWGDHIIAASAKPNYKWDIQEQDNVALARFGLLIDKEWFLKIVKMWVAEAENNNAFQIIDVQVTSTLIYLISNDYTPNFSYSDLLSIIDEIYEPEEKSAHIITCELFAGILLASKETAPKYWDERDEFIIKYLRRIFENDISPGTQATWAVFCFWVPSHIDYRRFKKVIDEILNFKLDPNSDHAFKDTARISYIKGILSTISWRYPHSDTILDGCIENINHKYNTVRAEIGGLLSTISQNYYMDGYQDSETFINSTELIQDNKLLQIIPKLFEKVEQHRLEVMGKTPQEILTSDYIYSATTILKWLRTTLHMNVSVVLQRFASSLIVPFLLELINMKEVCQLGNIDPITVLKYVSQITYTKNELNNVLEMLNQYSKKELNIVQSIVIGEFTETVFFKNLFNLSKIQREKIIDITVSLLYSKHLEVREAEAETLSGLIHMLPDDTVVPKFIKIFSIQLETTRSKYKRNFKEIPNEEMIKLHGSTLGLGALVHAFSFASPPPKWVPDVLTTIADNATGISGVVGKAGKNILARFRKDRQDSWHIDSHVFNEEHLLALEGVLFRSYFV
ncbi:BLM3 [Candida pseudojiufengensis]|uniref:BLM3 n=1 Tax=Candida pseudojiufengensis TaxID=497109 RepID=UPI00222474FD|nr:BLM3 [Candida pseudojiufengensis]KAI5960103.1 BLM3 [Candida pseudojiufengensis]